MSISLSSSARISSRSRLGSWLSPTTRLPLSANGSVLQPAPPEPPAKTSKASGKTHGKGKGRIDDRSVLPLQRPLTLLEGWRSQQTARATRHPTIQDDPSAPSLAYFSGNRAPKQLEQPSASTSRGPAFQEFLKDGTLPDTRNRLSQLMEDAYRAGREDVLERLLAKFEEQTEKIWMVEHALRAILALPVQAPYHAHIARLNRRTRRAVRKTSARQEEDDGISYIFFSSAWQQLWDLCGPDVHLEPNLARSILPTIMAMRVDSPSRLQAFQLPALRHLLFSAGITENPSLGLDLLAHAVAPHTFASAFHHAQIQRHPPTASVDEIVLIMQDLLRAGVLKPETVNEFNLPLVISKSLELPADQFIQLLRQTVLRIVARSYTARHVHDRALFVLRYLDLVEGGMELDRRKDGALAVDICMSALNASEHDGKWVSRVATLLIMALQGRLPYWTAPYMPPKLFQTFFSVALPVKRKQHPSIRSKYIPAALVWKAARAAAGADLALSNLSITHLGQIMAAFSRPFKDKSLSDSQVHFDDYKASATVARLQDLVNVARVICECIKDGREGQIASADANRIIGVLLRSEAGAAESQQERALLVEHEERILDVTRDLYALLCDSPFTLSDRFLISTDILVPLVRVVARSSSPQAAREIVRDYLRQRRALHGQPTPLELSTVARAFFVAGDRSAGLAVFTQLLQQRSLPDLVDIKILLRDVAECDALMAVELLQEMVDVGFRLDHNTAMFIINGIAENDSSSVEAFMHFLRSEQSQIPDSQHIVNSINAMLDERDTRQSRSALYTRVRSLENQVKSESSPLASTSRKFKRIVSDTLGGLMSINDYRSALSLLISAAPNGYVEPDVLLVYLSMQPTSLPKSTEEKNPMRSLRGAVLGRLVEVAEDSLHLLTEHPSGSGICAYSHARRLALLYGNEACARKLWILSRYVEPQLHLQADDLAIFRSVLFGKTRAEKRKWLFGDELDRLDDAA